ncbi:Putative phage terminase, small subunit, P27 family [uncultured Caudovirales phage]|uniref:Phage terminase, small subunit, P27 family n=1 Tax=uncultured Caudovirales phage TaxID=2100421 RepID=A0A6J5TB61_9CAUD|nr:Putative phage terminase, small subunit, P27 family [uncultured Caudovirales phage]CAB4242161.1 Putative phage terminase, small subunit, P27 family [uncultured Caudovirales phage]
MSAKLPPELHVVKGTTGMNQGQLMPDELRRRTPAAYWLDNPKLWDKRKFIKETSDFLYDMYGIGSEQEQHLISMLALQIETFIKCQEIIDKSQIIIKFNNGSNYGSNPAIIQRDRAYKLIIAGMNELGLTPSGRLVKRSEPTSKTSIGKLMQGVQLKR